MRDGRPRRPGALLALRRELLLLRRRRAVPALLVGAFLLAWLPLVLPALRAGTLTLAEHGEAASLSTALTGVVWPLLVLLFGADAVAGELEDRTLLPLVGAGAGRVSLLAGKLAARAGVVAAVVAVGFGTAALARPAAGARPALATLLLGFVGLVGGIFAAITGRTRARSLVLVLGSWLLFVFVIDAVLLALLVATAPAAPVQVGSHGHAELAAPAAGASPWAGAALLADPVDLFRLTAMDPEQRALAGARLSPLALAAGWLAWLGGTLLLLWRRSLRLSLF